MDLAVIGGGVAGSYVAYRLSSLRPEWAIQLFEATDRVGGRLISVNAPGIEGIRAELGGMRFRSSQPNVARLVRELGLATRPFRTVHDANVYALRGARLTAADFADPSRVPYSIDGPFRGKAPGELLSSALDAAIPGATQMLPDEWANYKRSATYNGRPLHEWRLGDVLRNVVGEDGYTLITDSFGYVSVFGDRNAADGIPWLLIEARPESENTTLVDGMERLPRELTARFMRQGGAVELSRRLTAVHRREWGFQLDFAGRQTVHAERLVLAIPGGALDLVDGLTAPRPHQGMVTAHPAGKLFIAYESAWWRASGVRGLRTVTDSPLQKIYWLDRAIDEAADGPALILSYTDGEAADVWRELAGRSTAPPDNDAYDGLERWQAYAIPDAMLARAHSELATLHRQPNAPRPYAAAYMDWAWQPAAGAYSLWNVGVKSWEVIPQIIQPSDDDALYVCGESYSDSQGWVEGALETAQMVVERLVS